MASAANLFQRHHLPLFRYLMRMTGSKELAEDLTQEVFVRVVRSNPVPERGGSEAAWLFHIARNLLLNRRRDEGRKPFIASAEEIPAVVAGQGDALDLDRALASLQESDRDVFLMRELGGVGYDEIAGICGLTPDAVRSRIYRARTELRAFLSEKPRHLWRLPPKEARS